MESRKPEWKLMSRVLKPGEKNVFEVFSANFYFPKKDPVDVQAGGSSSGAGCGAGKIANLTAKPVTSMDEWGRVTVVLSSDESQGSSCDNIPSPPPSAGGEEGDMTGALAIEKVKKKKSPSAGGDDGLPTGGIRITVKPAIDKPATTSAE